jgi:hypothetical protein
MGTPQITRSMTQSAPFKAGDRAHPGNPITGRFSNDPKNKRLPGSTGMPNRVICPPARLKAAGAMSFESDVADEVRKKIASPVALAIAFIIAVS